MNMDSLLADYGLIAVDKIDRNGFDAITSLRREPCIPLEWDALNSLREAYPWAWHYLHISTGFNPLYIVNTKRALLIDGTFLMLGHGKTIDAFKESADSWEGDQGLLWMRRHNRPAFEQLSWAAVTMCPKQVRELSFRLVPWLRKIPWCAAHERRCALNVRKCEEWPSKAFDARLRVLLRKTRPDPEQEIALNGPVRVWRGGRDRRGMSWTTDPDVAVWFARRAARMTDEDAWVYKTEVDKSDILAAYADDPESEVLVDARCGAVLSAGKERIA